MRNPLPRFLRRPLTILLRRLLLPPVEVVYHERYNAAFPNTPNDPLRAERILAFLASEGLLLRRCVHLPRPARLRTLERVHPASYLESVGQIETLSSIMGTELTADQVDRLLDLQRLHTGGTRLATRLALNTGHIAVNLAGGLHHAQREKGGGFCIFNDVAIAIEAERERGFDGEVLIVDLDLHDGDGTRAIFADDPHVFTFSIHAKHWGPPEALASYSLELGSKVSDATYLSALRQQLPQIFATLRPKLVFFLAGTDPSREDPMGDWRISSGGMLARDLLVLDLARGGKRKIPIVVTLAGGYGTEAWRYTARFLSAIMRLGKALEPPSTEEITLKRYRYIHRLFGSAELSGASDEKYFGLTEEDLYLPGWGAARETRFLGFYTKHGLELVFERSGFLDRLRDLGWSHPTLEMDLGDPAGHTLRLYDNPAKEEILAELRVQRDRRSIDGMELLSIEWLLLQNPRASFGPGRLPLPGQSHPGLGMVGDMVALLTVACERLHLDGLILVPAQLHVARLGHGYLHFLEPAAKAALRRPRPRSPICLSPRRPKRWQRGDCEIAKAANPSAGSLRRWFCRSARRCTG